MLEDLFSPDMSVEVPNSVLFVCTGNICRSPLGEMLLEQQLTELLGKDLMVGSAGVKAVVGAEMDAFPKQYVVAAGARGAHVARQLDEEIVHDAGLVLTMTENQRRWAGYQFPSAARRIFSLRWFVQSAQKILAEKEPPEGTFAMRFAWLVDQAARCRSTFEDLRDFDVQDPYRRSEEIHRQVAELIAAEVVLLVEVFRALTAGATDH